MWRNSLRPGTKQIYRGLSRWLARAPPAPLPGELRAPASGRGFAVGGSNRKQSLSVAMNPRCPTVVKTWPPLHCCWGPSRRGVNKSEVDACLTRNTDVAHDSHALASVLRELWRLVLPARGTGGHSIGVRYPRNCSAPCSIRRSLTWDRDRRLAGRGSRISSLQRSDRRLP